MVGAVWTWTEWANNIQAPLYCELAVFYLPWPRTEVLSFLASLSDLPRGWAPSFIYSFTQEISWKMRKGYEEKKGTEPKKQPLNRNSPEAGFSKLHVTGVHQGFKGQDTSRQDHGAGDSSPIPSGGFCPGAHSLCSPSVSSNHSPMWPICLQWTWNPNNCLKTSYNSACPWAWTSKCQFCWEGIIYIHL